jgi:hypothetical protein
VRAIPHELWYQAILRMLAASYGIALVVALIIRATFRRNRSHLSHTFQRGRHARPRLK